LSQSKQTRVPSVQSDMRARRGHMIGPLLEKTCLTGAEEAGIQKIISRRGFSSENC